VKSKDVDRGSVAVPITVGVVAVMATVIWIVASIVSLTLAAGLSMANDSGRMTSIVYETATIVAGYFPFMAAGFGMLAWVAALTSFAAFASGAPRLAKVSGYASGVLFALPLGPAVVGWGAMLVILLQS